MSKPAVLDYKKYSLEGELDQEQLGFFKQNSFLHFTNVLSKEDVQAIIDSYNEAQDKLISSGAKSLNGVPLFFGHDHLGKKIIHRMPFFSLQSKPMHNFIASGRLRPLQRLLEGYNSRIAEDEKDGVVFNHYINSEKSKFKKMGWHTDSIRDLFYDGKILPMLNIGVYLDDSSEVNGGLRILPGTHAQNNLQLLLRKAYFLNAREDKDEVLVVAKAGDVIVHHGHLWHRVASSPFIGEKSRRRIMYIPVVCGKMVRKDANSRVPLYHKLRPLTQGWF